MLAASNVQIDKVANFALNLYFCQLVKRPTSTMTATEKLCLQWNDFKENITSSFRELREDKEFTDVTVACEDGQNIQADKVVLASSSPFSLLL